MASSFAIAIQFNPIRCFAGVRAAAFVYIFSSYNASHIARSLTNTRAPPVASFAIHHVLAFGPSAYIGLYIASTHNMPFHNRSSNALSMVCNMHPPSQAAANAYIFYTCTYERTLATFPPTICQTHMLSISALAVLCTGAVYSVSSAKTEV